ncbi:JAB domain-containing protein [uncultured Draconibacterium sp.]|uniref:JAB domain-containing protein n=1 Tax=uncultured Draconibacterium sp. TaxID=1573823 RepID=UPI0029C85B20|nr:JAB domain-containing protein [uncultured Draconibacterium sp.]
MTDTKFTLNEIDIIYKPMRDMDKRPKITCSGDAYAVFRENWDDMKIGIVEQFKVMLLSRANKVLGVYTHSTGGQSGTVVDRKLIFATALKSGACSVIFAHNHPSGNLQPSEQDKNLQCKLEECGKILDISVLDHIILSGTDGGYYSFADGTAHEERAVVSQLTL